MVGTDGHEAGVLASSAGVGLHGDGVKAGDDGELLGEAVKHLLVADGLVGGAEGVEAAQLGPRDRDHLGGRVELHGAASERNHGVHEGQVLILEAFLHIEVEESHLSDANRVEGRASRSRGTGRGP